MIQLVTVASVRSVFEKPAVSIDTSDEAQTDLWAGRLSVSRQTLLDAVEAVGPSLAAIRSHLAG